MEKILYLFISLLISKGFAQIPNNAVPSNIRAANTLDQLSAGDIRPADLIYGIPIPPGEIIGDVYQDQEWRKTAVLLYSQSKLIEGYRCRYNILSNQIEIQTGSGERAIEGSKVKSFVWIDPKDDSPLFFVNAQDFKVNGHPQSGFLQVLSDGRLPLFKKTSIFIREPDYKPEFSMGSRDTRLIKREQLYYSGNDELFSLNTKNKRKFIDGFGELSTEIDSFINVNELKISNEDHVILIFEFFNKDMR